MVPMDEEEVKTKNSKRKSDDYLRVPCKLTLGAHHLCSVHLFTKDLRTGNV